MNDAMIRLANVTKNYKTGRGVVTALDDVSLDLDRGRFVCIRGPSGSGKTTLLLAIGGMLRPSHGSVEVDGQDVYAMGSGARADFRADKIGFVFQMFHLVPYLSALDNVLLSGRFDGPKQTEARALIERLGLGERAHHKPSQLSAGERQRTALARATLLKPPVILADEPTGNLDPDNAAEVIKILAQYRDDGGTVLVVTHGEEMVEVADRVIEMREGRLVNGTA